MCQRVFQSDSKWPRKTRTNTKTDRQTDRHFRIYISRDKLLVSVWALIYFTRFTTMCSRSAKARVLLYLLVLELPTTYLNWTKLSSYNVIELNLPQYIIDIWLFSRFLFTSDLTVAVGVKIHNANGVGEKQIEHSAVKCRLYSIVPVYAFYTLLLPIWVMLWQSCIVDQVKTIEM